jgi:hypothetical protein
VADETEIALAQIDAVLRDYEAARARSGYDGLSDEGGERAQFITRCTATIARLSPAGSVYRESVERSFENWGQAQHLILPELVGVLMAMRADVEAGYVSTLPELIHGELFGDFLEMAAHLLEGGYKDAAAVIAGSTLESHLRQLAAKSDVTTTNDEGRPLRAERLNADLVKAGAYGKGDQKSATAWFDLRNDAAHGDYEKYGQAQVALMIDSIRDFIQRLPA